MIPVTVQIPLGLFNHLEKVAAKHQSTVRDVIVGVVTRAAQPPALQSIPTRTGRRLKQEHIDMWVEAARMGVSNRAIAHRWGVDDHVVARALKSRGIVRSTGKAA